MSPLVLAAIFAGLALVFPFVSYVLKPRMKAREEIDDIAEVKASLTYLHTALPTILFILTAIGFGSYEAVVSRVTDKVTTEVNNYLKKVTIDSLVNEIQLSRQRAFEASDWIVSMQQSADDSIRVIARQAFLRLLPRGTIVPYSGRANDVDKTHWAVCDGTNNTPDLTDRFIMGATYKERGIKGGTRSHVHPATLRFTAQIIKTDEVKFRLKEGQGPSFEIERHGHAFDIRRQSVTLGEKEHLPPYYRLVYLMKIQ
jgi:hypothetical protein